MMKCEPLDIDGALLVHCDAVEDHRGSFTTLWESPDIYAHGLAFTAHSAHRSFNVQAGTLRGLHYQHPPHEQAKLVSCIAGRVWEVILDLRPDSRSYRRWSGIHLEGNDGLALFVPRGCAHGYVTLADNSAVSYLIEGKYVPDATAVVRWNDPAFAIPWPVQDPIVSVRDRSAPDYP